MNCCELYAGKLIHNVELFHKVSTPDGLGGFTISWQSYATPKAFIKPLSGYERTQGDRFESGVNVRGFLRYRNDMRASDKLVFDGREFNIVAFWNMEYRNKFLELDLALGPAL